MALLAMAHRAPWHHGEVQRGREPRLGGLREHLALGRSEMWKRAGATFSVFGGGFYFEHSAGA